MTTNLTDPDPQIAAWAKQFYADPSLAYEVLTGRREWDAETPASVIEEWSYEADELACDLKEANVGWAAMPELATRVRKLMAARNALSLHSATRAYDERLSRWQAEETCCPAPAPYLQSEFL
jgi:hypothetical protein